MKKLFMLLVAFAALCVSCSDSDSGDKSKGFPKDKRVVSLDRILVEGSTSSYTVHFKYDKKDRITEVNFIVNSGHEDEDDADFTQTYTYEDDKITFHYFSIDPNEEWGGYSVYTLENGLIVKSQHGESLDNLYSWENNYVYNSANELIGIDGSTVRWSNGNIVNIGNWSDFTYYEEYDMNQAAMFGISSFTRCFDEDIDDKLMYMGYFGKRPKNLLKGEGQKFTYDINSKGELTKIDYDGGIEWGGEYGVIQNIVYK